MNDEMTDTLSDTSPTSATSSTDACECECEACVHKVVVQDETASQDFMTKTRGSEEIALAFLLALTPLVVLTFFGQVGLI